MEIKTASRLGEVEEYYFSRKLKEIAAMRAEGKVVINLGIGSPDMAPANEVVEELVEATGQKGHHEYQSYIGIPALRKGFANWYKQWFSVALDANSEILPLIGSKEGIMHIAMTYLEAGDETLVPNPGYPAYRAVASLTGASIREYRLEEKLGWLPDLEQLEATDLSRVKIMWINYPNMPTGAQANISFFERLIALAKKHTFLIVNDNPYAFILNDKPQSILSIPGAKEVCLELNSLSKSHNMAGWRVGMLAGKSTYLQNILRFKSNMDSGMFKPVQLAAVKALELSPDWYVTLNAIYRKRRAYVFQLLDLLDCTYTTHQTGLFVWAKVGKKYTSGYALSDEILAKADVFITPGGIFGSQGEQYIRVALCSEISVFEEAIKRCNVLTKSLQKI